MENIEEDYENWYTLQVQGLRELKVQETIGFRKESGQLDSILDVYVPTQEVISISPKGKKSLLIKPIYPGYVFIKMNYNTLDVVEILALPFTQKFIGTKLEPVRMSIGEATKVLGHKNNVEEPTYRLSFEVGDNIRIKEGAFTEYKGEVKDINHEQNTAEVIVKILGRETILKVALHDMELID